MTCVTPARVMTSRRRQGPQGDLDRLLAVGGHRGAVGADLGGMDDPEAGVGFDQPGVGSQSVTYRELYPPPIPNESAKTSISPDVHGSIPSDPGIRGPLLLRVLRRSPGNRVDASRAPS